MKALVKLLTAVTAITLVAMPAGVFAHHSNSEYDQTVKVEIEGEIAKKFWKNPHVILHVTTTENGKQEQWIIEGSSVSTQNRMGISSDVIQIGDTVKIAGYVSTKRDNDMIMQNILLGNGQELMLNRRATPFWPEVDQLQVSNTGPTDAQVAEAKANADGLFRVWSWGALERGWWFFADPDAFPLTEAALDKFSRWNEVTENPQLECIPPGMPLTMGNPYPIEFTQHDENTIVMKAHEFDVTRVIHLDAKLVPTVEENIMGYSVGRWTDENTLEVETTNINYPYFNRVGISSGPDLTVSERFVIDDEADELHYFLTVNDPWALTETFEKEMRWKWVPGQQLGAYGCEVEGAGYAEADSASRPAASLNMASTVAEEVEIKVGEMKQAPAKKGGSLPLAAIFIFAALGLMRRRYNLLFKEGLGKVEKCDRLRND